MKKNYLLLFVLVLGAGCAAITEDAKIVWGSSTRALEKQKSHAMSQTFSCEVQECFAAVLKFANVKVDIVEPVVSPVLPVVADSALAPQATHSQALEVFSKDPKKNMIVVMGIPEHINTTEAGIFFTAVDGGTVVAVASQSTGAKIKVAEMIFADLRSNFKELKL